MIAGVGPGLVAAIRRTPPSRNSISTATTIATTMASRRNRPRRGAAARATAGLGISGPLGANGGRGRTAPVMDLATHVRQLRREVLQHSLQTNWRHSWQKRKLWTKDWYAASSILASSWRRDAS